MKSSFETSENRHCQQVTFVDNQFFTKYKSRLLDVKISWCFIWSPLILDVLKINLKNADLNSDQILNNQLLHTGDMEMKIMHDMKNYEYW